MMESLRRCHHILLLVCFCVCFLTGLSADKVEWKQVGEHVEIACSTRLQNQGGMYLYHTYHKTREVFYLNPGMKCTPRLPFDKRIRVTGSFTNVHATVSNLTVNDTGVFWCRYLRFDGAKESRSESNNNPTLLVVNGLEKECPTTAPVTEASEEPIQMSTLLVVSAITACSLFLLVLIILLICVRRCCGENGKFKPRPPPGVGLPAHRSDSVYEQMRPQRATSMSHSSGQVLLNPAYMPSPRFA
ncbi:uncharacterized protein si:rp71-81e14.2 [Sardina pilchardus]|uniref:uncharacterized protein si:rp71-81e14.2 n=1 Tax=Sardina pilchardus TaxID=27697 RepID=UPI002E112325